MTEATEHIAHCCCCQCFCLLSKLSPFRDSRISFLSSWTNLTPLWILMSWMGLTSAPRFWKISWPRVRQTASILSYDCEPMGGTWPNQAHENTSCDICWNDLFLRHGVLRVQQAWNKQSHLDPYKGRTWLSIKATKREAEGQSLSPETWLGWNHAFLVQDSPVTWSTDAFSWIGWCELHFYSLQPRVLAQISAYHVHHMCWRNIRV